MVKHVRDQTGRFQQRPHYEPAELDHECEAIVTAFLKNLHGSVRYPVATDDLEKLIEQDVEYLDRYADLSHYGQDVEGVTEFRPGKKPVVLIATDLGNDERRENRFRTTLTHEFGHVRFHRYLWESEPTPDLLAPRDHADKIICKRDGMLDAGKVDWMEWQAGYVCGALLMPKSAVLELCQGFVEAHGLFGAVSLRSPQGLDLVREMKRRFSVSDDAARVRLLKLGFATAAATTGSLFD